MLNAHAARACSCARVTQNRAMASCARRAARRGSTCWRSAWARASPGSAACALSQIGNVGPDLGQSYIVDSFMVVVLGGVGQLAGTVYAALGLGIVNKFLEPWQGAVLAKIAVLVFIILFIQKRPQGMFALKGRSGRGMSMRPHSSRARLARPVHCRAVVGPRVGCSASLRWCCFVARARLQPRRARRQLFHVSDYMVDADRQVHVLRDRRARDGPDLGLHRHPVARPRPVLRARRLRDGHVPDALDRPRRRLPERPAGLHGVPRLEGVPLVLDAAPTTSGTRRCSSCWCPGCSPSCSASSRSARASRACTSRSSPRR